MSTAGAASNDGAAPILSDAGAPIEKPETALRAAPGPCLQRRRAQGPSLRGRSLRGPVPQRGSAQEAALRSEEHTSELQSRPHLVCRLLLEKKNTRYSPQTH